MKIKVSVVLPSYNERDNIVEAIQRLETSLGDKLYEIIIVDDNSPDRTWEVVENLKDPKCRLIRRTDEKGLASAIATGVKAAKGNAVVWLDCDLGIPPEAIPRLVEKLDEYDIVIGSRYVEGGGDPRPFFRVFLSRMLNFYARMLFGSKITDYTSGVAAARKEAMDKVLWKSKGFGEYFAEFSWLCIKNKLRVKEIGLRYAIRKSGVSKSDGDIFTLLGYGWKYGLYMLKLKFGKG